MMNISVPVDPTYVPWDPGNPTDGGVKYSTFSWAPGMPPRLLGTLVIKSLREITFDLGGNEYKLEDRVPQDGWLGTATSATVHVEVKCKPLPSIFTFQRWEVIRMLEAVWEFSVIFGLFPSMVQEIIAGRGAHGYCSYVVQAGPGVARGSAGRLGLSAKNLTVSTL